MVWSGVVIHRTEGCRRASMGSPEKPEDTVLGSHGGFYTQNCRTSSTVPLERRRQGSADLRGSEGPWKDFLPKIPADPP